MLSFLLFCYGVARVHAQCTQYCPSGNPTWLPCDGNDPLDPYKCDSLGGGRGGNWDTDPTSTCRTHESLCFACREPCSQQSETTTADALFNDIFHCKPGECTSGPTQSPIVPGSPTSVPTPEPTHQCDSALDVCSDASHCDGYPSEEWYCDAVSPMVCTNTDNVCEACCFAQQLQESRFFYSAPEAVFDLFCNTGRCPTASPSETPTSGAPTPSPTPVTDNPTTAQPTTPDIGELDTIWNEPLVDSTADLSAWTIDIQETSFMSYRDGDTPGCPNHTPCWSLCSDQDSISSMTRSASTKRFDNIAFRYSIAPLDMDPNAKKGDERCELSYSLDDSTWHVFGAYVDSDIISDDLLFLNDETWDAESVSIKIAAHHVEAPGALVSCCYVSGFYFYGLRIPTFNPTKDPTPNPSNQPTDNPSLHPTRYPTQNPVPNPTLNPSYPTDNPVINPTNNPAVIPTDNPVIPTDNPAVNPTNNPAVIPTDGPTVGPIASTEDVSSGSDDDDSDDTAAGSQQQGSEQGIGDMLPVILGGSGAVVCLAVVVICGLNVRKNKQRQIRNSVQNMQPDAVPAQSPISDGSIALPMDTKGTASNMDGESKVVATGSGSGAESGSPFPKRQDSLHYVTKGGPDEAVNKPQTQSAWIEESDDSDNDNDVVTGGHTMGGPNSKEPTDSGRDSDDMILVGMQTPGDGIAPMGDDEEDESVPPPPLPPSPQDSYSDEDMVLVGMQTPGNGLAPLGGDDDGVVPPPPLPPTDYN